ncbi:MAG: apolipoprotein N-acyltransferase [Rickettsiales bacterium]|jgi:apolipoprotein N-acyltransferase|nr:apolipoprotein N-acyltransferase [Rickettsiales bacterium]
MFKKYKFSFIYGFIGGLAFPPLYLIFFLPITFDYLLKNIQKMTYKDAIIFSTAYFLPQFYWCSFSLLVDRTFILLFPFVVFFVPMVCAIYLLVVIYIMKKIKTENKFLQSVIFAFLYVIFEYLRGLFLPWNFIAYSLAFSDALIQIASILNVYVFDFILVVLSCFLYVLERQKKQFFLYVSLYLVFPIFILIFGIIRLHNATTIIFPQKILLVQPNIKQEMKFDREEAFNNIKTMIDLSEGDADIVIWPESSFPYTLKKNAELMGEFERIRDKVLIVGAIRTDDHYNMYNSLFIFKDNKTMNYYDKIKLVPFGEYMPFPFINNIFGFQDFIRGNDNKTFKIDKLKISPVICYEIAFPNGVINKKNKPDVIVNITNDAWFGKTSGPYQHLVIAKFRAIENKMPVIRVANTGISAYINEYGEVKKKLGLNEVGVLKIWDDK